MSSPDDGVLHFGDDEGPCESALDLRWNRIAHAGYESLASAYEALGPRLWDRSELPRPLRLVLPSFPIFDEMWTAYRIWHESEGSTSQQPEWATITRYATDARQGFWTDRVLPELAPQAVYLAVAQHHLVDGVRNERRFIEAAFDFFDRMVAVVSGGGSLTDSPWVQQEPTLQRYVTLLVNDREVYRTRDRPRASAWVGSVPAEHAPRGRKRETSLLVLDAPEARNFAQWARRDPDAPNGLGFELLLVAIRDRGVTLSSDPTIGLRVDWLADGLDARDSAPWYRGERHRHSLVGAPKGSQLQLADVLEIVRKPLELRACRAGRPTASVPRGTWLLAGLVAATFAALGAMVVRGGHTNEAEPPPAMDADSRSALRSRFRAKSGGELERHALVVGVCEYRDAPDRRLLSPCNDARDFRDHLVGSLGYADANVVLMVDDHPSDPSLEPTASNIRSALEGFRERGLRDDSSFLFFYSGHGDYQRGARVQYGVLQPAGYFRGESPEHNRGIDMQLLRNDIEKSIRSRHVMVLLDACRSGWSTTGATSTQTTVHERWSDPTFVVLAAAGRAQEAWSPPADDPQRWGGHSAFTHAVLAGLGASDDRAPADRDSDGLISDDELFRYVREEVPRLVGAAMGSRVRQEPQFQRFEVQGASAAGQFLFVSSADSSPGAR